MKQRECHRPCIDDAGEDGQHGGAGEREPPGGLAEAEKVVRQDGLGEGVQAKGPSTGATPNDSKQTVGKMV